jgi:hypothetical protein
MERIKDRVAAETMPPERKPEEKLVRLSPGDSVEIDGVVVVRLREIRAGRQAWIEVVRQVNPPIVRTIDKVSTT